MSPVNRLNRLLVVALLIMCAPAPWTHAKAGALLSAELVETLEPRAVDREVRALFENLQAPIARFAVDCYLVRFESRYPDGRPATVTAQLFVPLAAEGGAAPKPGPGQSRPPRAESRAAYVFAPGTTGLIDACRPSREHIAGIHWGLYRAHVLAFAGQGVVGVLPDYMGFGDGDRLQPIYHAVAEGRMMLDAVRALHRFLESLDEGRPGRRAAKPSVFLAGFSQGGHAAFAAADLRRPYAPDVRLAGLIGYGPTTDLEALFREFPVVAPMAIYTFSQLYGIQRFDPARILLDRWASGLADDVTRQCVGGMQSYYPWTPRELFRREFADALLAGRLAERYPEVHRILRQHSTGLAGHRLPCLILQGGDDVVVSAASQERFVRLLCRTGSPVLYRHYRESRHDTRQVGFTETLAWIQRLSSGQSAPSNCRELAAERTAETPPARAALTSP